MYNFLTNIQILMHIYKILQPLFLKDITAYPSEQTQSSNARSLPSDITISSPITGFNLETEDASSGSETKGRTHCLLVIILSVYLGILLDDSEYNTICKFSFRPGDSRTSWNIFTFWNFQIK